jgi:hypothetical protein
MSGPQAVLIGLYCVEVLLDGSPRCLVEEVVNGPAELVQALLVERQSAGGDASSLSRLQEWLQIVPVGRLVVWGTEQGFNQSFGGAAFPVFDLGNVGRTEST